MVRGEGQHTASGWCLCCTEHWNVETMALQAGSDAEVVLQADSDAEVVLDWGDSPTRAPCQARELKLHEKRSKQHKEREKQH